MSTKMYFVRSRGKVSGPYDLKKLKFLRDRGQLARFHELSEDRSSWAQAGTMEDLFPSAPVEVVVEPTAVAPAWYYAIRGGRQQGPVDSLTLAQLWSSGDIADSTQVWNEGMEKWSPITSLPPGQLPSLPPRRKGSIAWKWVALCAAILLAVPGAWFGYKWLGGDNHAPAPGAVSAEPQRLPAKMIENITDENEMSQAVGLVVCGLHFVDPYGSESEKRYSTGTCFAISPGGYLVTNKHVVEEVRNLKNAKLLLKKWQDELLVVVTPQVWVFFQKTKHIAEINFVSDEHDFAILKINRQGGPYFNLAASDSFPRGKKVFACGFPGVASIPLSDQELVLRLSRESLNKEAKTRIDSQLSPRELDYTLTDGTVSRVTTEEGASRKWIQHTASINPGNSGGPLLSEQGNVVGINTQGIRPGVASGIFYSLPIAQVRTDIAKHVPNAIWSD